MEILIRKSNFINRRFIYLYKVKKKRGKKNTGPSVHVSGVEVAKWDTTRLHDMDMTRLSYIHVDKY